MTSSLISSFHPIGRESHSHPMHSPPVAFLSGSRSRHRFFRANLHRLKLVMDTGTDMGSDGCCPAWCHCFTTTHSLFDVPLSFTLLCHRGTAQRAVLGISHCHQSWQSASSDSAPGLIHATLELTVRPWDASSDPRSPCRHQKYLPTPPLSYSPLHRQLPL